MSQWQIPTLYEDADLVVVNKPAGLPTQAGHDPKRPNLYGLLQQARGEKLFLHHRLDKDTSGALVMARATRANKGLTELFREHHLEKIYWALAKKNDERMHAPLVVKDHLAPVRGPAQKLMRMVRVKSGGWAAETHLTCLEQLEKADLWEARPTTGRTHQIRVHLAGLGRPILGDFLYGGKSSEVPRLLLHARSIQFKHPVTGQDLNVVAPLPDDFHTLLVKWGSKKHSR